MTKAVEAEYPIQQEMIFKDDEFFIDALSHVFADVKSEEKSFEPIGEVAFTISQLDKINDILFNLAPSGFIAERCLAFLLQDILTKEDNHNEQQTPLIWSRLKSDDINKLFFELFGDIEYVPWKEFITRNFLISYPDINELLKLRKQFMNFDQNMSETVTEEDYDKIEFWFQTSALNAARAEAIRKLLFKLYKCKGNLFNYTAMLLDFCKGNYSIMLVLL